MPGTCRRRRSTPPCRRSRVGGRRAVLTVVGTRAAAGTVAGLSTRRLAHRRRTGTAPAAARSDARAIVSATTALAPVDAASIPVIAIGIAPAFDDRAMRRTELIGNTARMIRGARAPGATVLDRIEAPARRCRARGRAELVRGVAILVGGAGRAGAAILARIEAAAGWRRRRTARIAARARCRARTI